MALAGLDLWPAVTIWVFLSQCLSMDHSCRDAVARLITWRVAQVCVPARRTLVPTAPLGTVSRSGLPPIGSSTGTGLEREVPTEWRWHKRRAGVVDGSTITMPDTPANQAEYPQMASQKPGCGFPIARIVVVFSFRSERC